MALETPTPVLPKAYCLSEAEVITRSRLLAQLQKVGIRPADLVCVHSSLSGLGFVIGGARTVIDCLEEAVGPAGTLMMPAFSGDVSDPAEWRYPSIPNEMIDEVRQEMPPFDSQRTPTRNMGVIAELFRHRDGTVRSCHPQSSFCAKGPLAVEICSSHSFDYRFGYDSPLGALTRLDGKVLLAGAPWNTASLFYLTEFAMPDRVKVRKKVPIPKGDYVEWIECEELQYRDVWHDAVAHLVEIGSATHVRTSTGHLVLFSARESVAAVTQWRLKVIRPGGERRHWIGNGSRILGG
jgi:aminoglycoside 3-N-acetyltransferase